MTSGPRPNEQPPDNEAPEPLSEESGVDAPPHDSARASPGVDERSATEEPHEEPVELIPPRRAASTRRVRSWTLTGIFTLGLFYTLHFAREILLPIVLAALLALLLTPVADALDRLRLPRWLTSAVLVIGLVGGVVFGVTRLAAPAGEWAREAPRNIEQLESRLRELLEPVEQVGEAADRVEDMAQPDASQQEVRVESTGLRERLFGSMRGLLAGGLVMFVLLYFLLASGDLFTRKLIRVMPTFGDKRIALTVARQIQAEISGYLLTITLINAGLGVAVGGSMFLMGLPNPVLWGVAAALLNYVPYLGAITGVIIIGLVALGHFDDPGRALSAPAVYLALTAFEGSVVTPTILGQRLRLNPVAVFVGLLFWGWLWGIPGALFAVPILVAFKVVCDHYPPLAPVAEFLGR